MRARILDPQVKVYSSMDANTISIATLNEGTEVELGTPKRNAGKLWLPITLSTGQQAYIAGETRLSLIRLASLMQNNIELHTEPTAGSLVKQQLPRNTKIYVLEVIKREDQDWVKVRDMSGLEGYIAGNTGIRVIQEKTKAMARRNLLSAVMWLIAGIIIIFSSGSPATGGGFVLLGYGAIVFGGVMLVTALLQLFRAQS